VTDVTDFINLPMRDEEGNVRVVVEAPRGSTVKFKYEPAVQGFVFQRALPLGVRYPYDWGFIPSTRAADGDPLDAMTIFDEPTWPGILIPSIPIGIVCLVQREGTRGPRQRNDRIITLPAHDERYADVRDLPRRVREELEQFFIIAAETTSKEVTVEGWKGPKAALRAIHNAGSAYQRRPVAT
jgi:inorganic pyrophosphatase